MRLIRYAAVAVAALLCGCASLHPTGGFTSDSGGPSHPGHRRFVFAAASPGPLAPPQEINCIQSSATPCSSQSHIGSGDQGEPAWLIMGKLNDWGLQLGLFANQAANQVEATPNGAAGIPTLRALVGADIPPINLALVGSNGGVTGILPLAEGGTGTATPSLIAGTNITLSGTWPNQTINATGGSGSGTVISGIAGQVGCYAATGTAISGCGLANGLAINSGTLGISEAVNAQTGTSYTVATTDCGKQITLNNASAIAVSVPQANGSFAGCQFDVTDIGAGTATLTPTTSTINGTASLAVAQNRQCTINSDGTNWQVIGCTALVSGGGSGQPQDVQIFTTSGTWTKPAWAASDATATTKAICTGGGGGGGSGSVEPSGTAAPGGGGGGGGATADMLFQTSALAATVSVTVGIGGTGGIARTSTSNGQNGGNGGSSSFGSLTAPGGGYGSGGATGTSTSGGGGAGILTGGNGGTSGTMCSGASSTGTGSGGNPGCPTGGAGGGGDQSSGSGGSAGGPTFAGGAGGGAGGGLTTASAASTGGAGGAVASATGPAGGATCTAGTAGTNGGAYGTGSAGSGGGSCATAATNAGTGGNGGTGSGGGGGGANINGDGNSGAGGTGGNGLCVAVTSY